MEHRVEAQTHGKSQRDRQPSDQPILAAATVRAVDDQPSYRLRRDPGNSGISALRDVRVRGGGSFFSRSSTSLTFSDPDRTNALPGTNRRSSFTSMRPLTAAATISNLLVSKAVVKDDYEKQHEAMVQLFQLRRLEPPKALTRGSNEEDTVVSPALVAEAETRLMSFKQDPSSLRVSSQSSLADLRNKSFAHTQLPSARRSNVSKLGSNHSMAAHDQSIAKLGRPASRFSLSRQIKTWRRRLTSKWRRVMA